MKHGGDGGYRGRQACLGLCMLIIALDGLAGMAMGVGLFSSSFFLLGMHGMLQVSPLLVLVERGC